MRLVTWASGLLIAYGCAPLGHTPRPCRVEDPDVSPLPLGPTLLRGAALAGLHAGALLLALGNLLPHRPAVVPEPCGGTLVFGAVALLALTPEKTHAGHERPRSPRAAR